MKILDKYVAKNFLIGYAITFCVLMGMRAIIDMFVNLDEFTEHANLNTWEIAKNILRFYAINSTIYFRDFSGIITSIAACFTLSKMTTNNELTAIMASGVSLKRVIMPIIFLSMILTGLLVIDQEFLIPPLADKLVRSHDVVAGEEAYDVWFINDGNNSLICSEKFDVKTATFHKPTIITRQRIGNSSVWKVTGRITADTATYNTETKVWDLENGQYIKRGAMNRPTSPAFYKTDILPRDIPIRRQSQYKDLLSSAQLSALAKQGLKIKDRAQLYSQKQFRITDPIINMILLLISLPILVCRDPKSMKSAILLGFTLIICCFVTNFICKMLATEMIFAAVTPEMWAWLPIIIFLPIAMSLFESMKT